MTAKRTTFTPTRHQNGSMFTRGQNLTTFDTKGKLGPVFSVMLIVGLIAILSVIYLFQITKSTSYSYVLDGIETEKAELLAESEDLRNENARLQSAQATSGSGVAAAMTTPVSIEQVN
jgi:hypothetical protein